MDAKEEIKTRLSVEEVVGDYLELRPSGRNLKALSPFSSEKTPSFMVSPEKQIWHDFSSSKGGDIFSFVMIMEGVDFVGAMEILARKAGVDMSQYQRKSGASADLKNKLLKASELAVGFYQRQLIKSPSSLNYLKERGFTKETLIDWRLGYANDSFDGLLKYLTNKGFTSDELQKAGLVTSRNGKTYDIFRGRITIPLADGQGQYIGFTARLLAENDRAPKYLNTPQTMLYDKSRHVFGLHLAKEAIRNNDSVVISEGNTDVITSHQADIKNVVASAGTALTIYHIKQLERLSRNIKLAFDSDRAGLAATERAIALASERKLNLEVITIPEGKDPDELIKKDPQLWQQAIRRSEPAMDWLIKHYSSTFDITRTSGKREFADKMTGIIKKVSDPVEVDSYIAKVAKSLDVSRDSIQRKLTSAATTKRFKKPAVDLTNSDDSNSDATKSIIDELIIFAMKDRANLANLKGFEEDLDSEQATLVSYLTKYKTNPKAGKIPQELSKIDNYVKIQLFKIEELYGEKEAEDYNELSQKLRHRLNKQLKIKKQQPLLAQLREAEEANDSLLQQKITQELNTLLKEK